MEACIRWSAHLRNLANTIKPSMCDGDAAFCQITLTTHCCYFFYFVGLHTDERISSAYFRQSRIENMETALYFTSRNGGRYCNMRHTVKVSL